MSTYTGTLDEIYNAEWVRGDFADLQPEFDLVADAIYRQFRPDSVVDIGCGPGLFLQRMYELDVLIHGVEGSRHCVAFADERIKPAIDLNDLTKHPGFTPGRFDLAICTEVAEHIEEEHAPTLVNLLASAMCPLIFTAAPPGQDGHHHVNCQPPEYWDALFAKRGMYPDLEATTEMKVRWSALQKLSHMTRNVRIYR